MALTRVLLTQPNLTRLVCYSRSESRQALCQAALPDHPSLRWVLGDVRDVERLEEAMGGCEAVIHAAALKRVDAGAYSPMEMVATNVLGTQHVIKAAVRAGVARVLVVSSDKAVEPTNIYGVTKACAEHLAIAANGSAHPRGTRIGCVRYGNVLASTGSVVELWRRAVAAGTPLLVTDPECTRFWLTLEQAARFCLTMLGMLRGGEIFIPQLRAMRVGDLVSAVADAGYPRDTVGLRPGGEKQHETLLSAEESTRTVAVGVDRDRTDAWVINPSIHTWCEKPPWEGEPWPAGALYRSDLVPRLSVDQMRAWLKEIP